MDYKDMIIMLYSLEFCVLVICAAIYTKTLATNKNTSKLLLAEPLFDKKPTENQHISVSYYKWRIH